MARTVCWAVRGAAFWWIWVARVVRGWVWVGPRVWRVFVKAAWAVGVGLEGLGVVEGMGWAVGVEVGLRDGEGIFGLAGWVLGWGGLGAREK